MYVFAFFLFHCTIDLLIYIKRLTLKKKDNSRQINKMCLSCYKYFYSEHRIQEDYRNVELYLRL